MEAPRRLALDTSKRTICGPLLCCAVLDHMNCNFATTVPKHGKTLNCLATRPQMEIPQAVSRQVCPTDPDCVSFKTHGSLSGSGTSPLDLFFYGGRGQAASDPGRHGAREGLAGQPSTTAARPASVISY